MVGILPGKGEDGEEWIISFNQKPIVVTAIGERKPDAVGCLGKGGWGMKMMHGRKGRE